jgi:hypothetical protein
MLTTTCSLAYVTPSSLLHLPFNVTAEEEEEEEEQQQQHQTSNHN